MRSDADGGVKGECGTVRQARWSRTLTTHELVVLYHTPQRHAQPGHRSYTYMSQLVIT